MSETRLLISKLNRAPDNAGAFHIDRIQIQMTISSAPSGLVAFVVTPTQAKAWVCVGFEGGFGPKGLGNLAQEPVGFEAELDGNLFI